MAAMQRAKATPPPGTIALFHGCAVGVHGVFDTSLLSFISVSVAAPT